MNATTAAARYLVPDTLHPPGLQPARRPPHQAGHQRHGLAHPRGARPDVRRAALDAGQPAHRRRRSATSCAPRGETQWVRNLRAAGSGTLRVGRRVETFDAVELADADKPPILRAYLKAWAWEVGRFFDGLAADSPDADDRRRRPRLPAPPRPQPPHRRAGRDPSGVTPTSAAGEPGLARADRCSGARRSTSGWCPAGRGGWSSATSARCAGSAVSARGTPCSQSRWLAPPITIMSPSPGSQHDVVGVGAGRDPLADLGQRDPLAEHERPALAEHDDGDARVVEPAQLAVAVQPLEVVAGAVEQGRHAR